MDLHSLEHLRAVHCCHCHKHLTNETSIFLGIGPVCVKRSSLAEDYKELDKRFKMKNLGEGDIIRFQERVFRAFNRVCEHSPGLLEVHFTYDKALVALIKSVPGARFHRDETDRFSSEKNFWVIPLSSIGKLYSTGGFDHLDLKFVWSLLDSKRIEMREVWKQSTIAGREKLEEIYRKVDEIKKANGEIVWDRIASLHR